MLAEIDRVYASLKENTASVFEAHASRREGKAVLLFSGDIV